MILFPQKVNCEFCGWPEYTYHWKWKWNITQAQCQRFLDRAVVLNKCRMNIHLGFIQHSQSRTVLFALFSSDEITASERKMLSREKAGAVKWCSIKIQGDELNDPNVYLFHNDSHIPTVIWSAFLKKNSPMFALLSLRCSNLKAKLIVMSEVYTQQTRRLFRSSSLRLTLHVNKATASPLRGSAFLCSTPWAYGSRDLIRIQQVCSAACLFFNCRSTVGRPHPQGM